MFVVVFLAKNQQQTTNNKQHMIIFWHRRDLRISDNIGLAAARQQTPKVLGIFCLDPNILERDDIAPARVTYLLGCLFEIVRSYLDHQNAGCGVSNFFGVKQDSEFVDDTIVD